jgi:hypothetical protein
VFRQPTAHPSRRLLSLVRLSCFALLLVGAAQSVAAQTVTFTRTSGATFYWDGRPTPPLSQQYVAFSITSTTAIADAWVQLSNLPQNDLAFAIGEDGKFHIGAMTANETRHAFFLLRMTTVQNNRSAGSYNAALPQRSPPRSLHNAPFRRMRTR